MRIFSLWIVTLIMLCGLVRSIPVLVHDDNVHLLHDASEQATTTTEIADRGEGEIISVRITSSVAVNRGKGKTNRDSATKLVEHDYKSIMTTTETLPANTHEPIDITVSENVTRTPQELEGANIEFLKQLKAKKEARGLKYGVQLKSNHENRNKHFDADSEVDESVKSILEVPLNTPNNEFYSEDVPLARSVPFAATRKKLFHGLNKAPINERLTTSVSYQIVHNTPKSTTTYTDHSDQALSISTAERYLYSDTPKEFSIAPKLYTETLKPYSVSPKYNSETQKVDSEIPKLFSEPPKSFSDISKPYSEPEKSYSEPSKVYSEPEKIYSQPAKVYSVPAKIYSEPAKIYSEPAKVYSEPAKVYSEPAKVYGEPAKFYSQPASLHLPPQVPGNGQDQTPSTTSSSDTASTTRQNVLSKETSTKSLETDLHHQHYHQSEKNYEVDEKESVITDGKSHGIQENSGENCKEDNCKVGYVVEGRQYRKYRVEERTADGFIVGEYGVVRHEDGALRGVRYTADGDASPTLIYDALMKFLQLK